MKVLLINPCVRSFMPEKLFPMGLAYIATAIHNAGYDLTIFDIDAHRFTDREVETFIRNKKFDIIAFGCLVNNYKWVKSISVLIRENQPHTTIIVGNSVSTSIPELLLEHTEVDIAVVGEGDISIIEVLKRLEQNESLEGVNGIYYKENGSIIKNNQVDVIKDINTIPFPNRDLFDIELYLEASPHNVGEPLPLPLEQIRAMNVNSARGCVFKCTFCYHNFQGHRFRRRSNENIIAEIKQLKEKYDINYVLFWDDLSFANRKQFEGFSDMLIEKDLNIFWSGITISGALKKGDEEIAKKIKKSGGIVVGFSLESANQAILDMMKKPVTKEKFSETKNVLNSAGIYVPTSLVFGYPIETEETIKDTINFCINEGLVPSAGFLLPLPGAEMYDYAKEKGFITNEEEYLLNLKDRQDLYLNLTSMSDEKFVGLVQQGIRKCQETQGVIIKGDNPLKTGKVRVPKKLEIKSMKN